mmetsp:Transcript_16993/g.46784  ORF Transcript_16993/g.46784 Transcript_16993/m.46784 type:complete len:335 (-) Transcript_16993:57-1061(-)
MDAANGSSALALIDVLSIVEAFETAGKLDDTLLHAAAASLRHCAGKWGCLAAGLSADAVAHSAPAALGSERHKEPRVLAASPSMLVLWKPPGWIVSVADGGRTVSGQRVPGRARLLQKWVAAAFGSQWPIARDLAVSQGIVHRLDRDTSGALLWAGRYGAYYAARLEFAARRVRKEYVCLCHGHAPRAAPRMLLAPLREAPAVCSSSAASQSEASPRGRPARTELAAVRHLVGPEGCGLSLVAARLHTGRLHQIRVHLAHEGHPLVGDGVYGNASSSTSWCSRVFLHAAKLGVDIGEGPLLVAVPLPADLCSALSQTIAMDGHSHAGNHIWSKG